MLNNEEVYLQPWKLWYNESIKANHVTSFQVLINTTWQWINDINVKQGTNGFSINIDISNYINNKLNII